MKFNSVQQNLFDNVEMPYQNEVDRSIYDFNNNIQTIYDFEHETEIEDKKEPITQTIEPISQMTGSNSQINKFDEVNPQTELEPPTINEVITPIQDNNLLSELDTLGIQNETSFDIQDYQDLNTIENENTLNEEKNANLDENNPQITQNQEDLEKNEFIDYKINDDEDRSYNADNSSAQQTNYSSTDDIYSITRDEPEEFFTFDQSDYFPTSSDTEYKKKLQNLSKYTKISPNNPQNEEIIPKSKDIQVLKQEFEKEGIKVKQYNKNYGTKVSKEYLLINKLNLIKSLILMFAFVFILSASYIIMNNSPISNMQDFSIKYFLFAMIPYIIYFLYYLIVFLFFPKKKIPSRYSSRIMMFFSVIITIQLLLIIYCINLQFGFYSFTQAGYNHLLWILPSILSITPMVTTLIHIILYNSKNFNV